MRHTLLIPAAALLAILAGCADNDALSYEVAPSDSLTAVSYVNKYDVLKNYVDRTASPNLKLGVGVSMSSVSDNDVLARIATTNFDEITPSSELTYGTLVDNGGSIDTTTVIENLQACADAGLAVYGHSLMANDNQNTTYLTSLLEDRAVSSGDDDLSTAYCFKATNTVAGGSWETQAVYTFLSYPAVTAGNQYEIEMMVKGSVEGSIAIETFTNWTGSSFDSPITVTTEWTQCTSITTAPDITNLASIIFQMGAYVGTLYVDDIKLYELDDNGNRGKNLNTENYDMNDPVLTEQAWANTFSWSISGFSEYGSSEAGEGYVSGLTYVALTDEEKADALDYEMRRYIKSMMEASEGYITAWDVVDEPMDDDNPANIKQGPESTDDLEDGEFYWQDFLGRDYAVKAFQYARQYGGSDVKLFINDYGLETADGQKLDGLLDLVDYIESQGATVDGIGTEMHLDVTTADITAIGQMFQKLAATGKLVRISQLDMGIGDGTLTANVTDEQYQEQAELYQQIIEAYMTHVPAAQRYGITHWSPVDASTSASYKPGEPIGLWTESYSRKRAYAGFANGLAGTTVYASGQ